MVAVLLSRPGQTESVPDPYTAAAVEAAVVGAGAAGAPEVGLQGLPGPVEPDHGVVGREPGCAPSRSTRRRISAYSGFRVSRRGAKQPQISAAIAGGGSTASASSPARS